MVPEVLQFYGMELNMPAMDHHTLIIPSGEHEALMLSDIESRFDSQEAWPADPRETRKRRQRRARVHEERCRYCPSSLPIILRDPPKGSASMARMNRGNSAINDARARVYHGMEGAPGHQAAALAPDGSLSARGGQAGGLPRLYGAKELIRSADSIR